LGAVRPKPLCVDAWFLTLANGVVFLLSHVAFLSGSIVIAEHLSSKPIHLSVEVDIRNFWLIVECLDQI
jgi:hypothetical protein